MENNNKSITLDDAKSKVLNHLSEKYGKSFECVGHETPSATNNEYTFALVEVGYDYDGYGFKAYYNPSSDDGITDGYFGILMRDDLTPCVTVSGAGETMRVFAETGRTVFDNSLTQTSNIDDVTKIYGTLRVYYTIFLPAGNKLDVDKVQNAIPENITGKISYYEIPETNYNEITYENLHATIREIINGNIPVASKGEVEF